MAAGSVGADDGSAVEAWSWAYIALCGESRSSG